MTPEQEAHLKKLTEIVARLTGGPGMLTDHDILWLREVAPDAEDAYIRELNAGNGE